MLVEQKALGGPGFYKPSDWLKHGQSQKAWGALSSRCFLERPVDTNRQSHTGPVTHLYCRSPHSANSTIARRVACEVEGDRHVTTLQTNRHQPPLTTHNSSCLTGWPSRIVNRRLGETHHKHCIFEKQFIKHTLFSVCHKNYFENLYLIFIHSFFKKPVWQCVWSLGGQLWAKSAKWYLTFNILSPILTQQTFAPW